MWKKIYETLTHGKPHAEVLQVLANPGMKYRYMSVGLSLSIGKSLLKHFSKMADDIYRQYYSSGVSK
jgi:hypothetical protein